MSRARTVVLSVLLAGLPMTGWAADTEHVKVELIAENTAIGPGVNWLALRLVPDPDWHVYWLNPGDSGLATTLRWTLPAGVTAGSIEWPTPHSFRFGPLTSYGYGEEVLHLVPITVPAGFQGPFEAKVDANWLVCAGTCIPGKASLGLKLPLAPKPTPDARWAAAIARTRAALPKDGTAWKSAFATTDGRVTLSIEGAPAKADKAEFFPEPADLVDHSAPQHLTYRDGAWRLQQKLSPYASKEKTEVHGVLVLQTGKERQAWRIHAKPASK